MMIREKTTIAAHGRWREILPALGIPTDFLTGKKQPCLFCGGIDRARFDDRNHDGGYFCNQCGPGNGIKLLMQFHGWDYARAAQEVDKIIGNLPPRGPEFHTTQAANPGACRRMYAASCPVEDGDPVGRYLINRGLAPLQWPRTLRYIEELRHKPSGTVQHGMLAVFSDAHGKPATIHRTFLTGDGCKADVDPVRMFMPGNMPVGGAIRLRDAAEMMGVAEGIETALSASALFDMPVWATTSANLMEKWQPPEVAKHITIFADNDLNYVGQCAAYTLAKRLVFETGRDKIERTVNVMVSPRAGTDWNDHIGLEEATDAAA